MADVEPKIASQSRGGRGGRLRDIFRRIGPALVLETVVIGPGTLTLNTILLVVLIFEAPPVELIRVAQGMAIIAFPLLGFLVLSLAGDRKIMGEHVNRRWVQVIAVIGYITILGIVVNYVRRIVAAL